MAVTSSFFENVLHWQCKLNWTAQARKASKDAGPLFAAQAAQCAFESQLLTRLRGVGQCRAESCFEYNGLEPHSGHATNWLLKYKSPLSAIFLV